MWLNLPHLCDLGVNFAREFLKPGIRGKAAPNMHATVTPLVSDGGLKSGFIVLRFKGKLKPPADPHRSEYLPLQMSGLELPSVRADGANHVGCIPVSRAWD